MTKEYSIETKCIQSGYKPKNGEPRVLPLYQSTAFKYDSADEVGKLFDLEMEGHMYSRISNPTVEALEEKINDLEGGVGAVATSSGQSAITLAILTICEKGDNFITASNLYGGTVNLFNYTLKKLGIEARYIDINDERQDIEKLIDENTKLIYGETIGNPGVDVIDIEKFANIAHDNNIPLILDNTFATPVLCRPFDYGCDILIHSTTKFLDGHASSVGGVVVDSGKFDWDNKRFSCLVDKDPSYHGLSYTETFKEKAFITKARTAYIRDIGFVMSPFNAYLTNMGMETLYIRMKKHCENAQKISEYLENNDKVAWVKYPGLKSGENYELTEKYLKNGAGGIISFGLKGDANIGKKFIDSLELITLVVHVADVRSHVLHPASMTHRQLTEEEQKKAGIKPEQIRLSVGIEDVDDIIRDLDQAIESALK